MAFTGTVASEADIALMAGELVDATGDTEANRNLLMTQAEAFLCNLVKYDIVANWDNLNTKYRGLFTEWAARYCACALIMYNMGTVGATFSSLIEPEDMVQFHVYRMGEIERVLEASGIKAFLGVN